VIQYQFAGPFSAGPTSHKAFDLEGLGTRMRENKDKPFFQDSEPDVAYFLNQGTGSLWLNKIDFANNVLYRQ